MTDHLSASIVRNCHERGFEVVEEDSVECQVAAFHSG
jgi:hypothetical protein